MAYEDLTKEELISILQQKEKTIEKIKHSNNEKKEDDKRKTRYYSKRTYYRSHYPDTNPDMMIAEKIAATAPIVVLKKAIEISEDYDYFRDMREIIFTD